MCTHISRTVGQTCLQLEQAYRGEFGRPRQRMVANRGRLDRLAGADLEPLIGGLQRALGRLHAVAATTPPVLESARAYEDVFAPQCLWDEMGLGRALKRAVRLSKRQLDVEALVRLIVFNRLCDPTSKLGVLRWLQIVAMMSIPEGVSNDHLLRAMDALTDNAKAVQQAVAGPLRLLPGKFPIQRVVFIADRGLLNLDNLAQIEQMRTGQGQPLEYILSECGRRYGEFAQTLPDVVFEDDIGEAPICRRTHIVKYDFAVGLQRYLYRNFPRIFNALIATPLAGLHKRGKWLQHAQALGDSLNIPQVATRLSIASSTVFRWRHRFLQLSSQLQASTLVGIAEADESYFSASERGERGLLRKARPQGWQSEQAAGRQQGAGGPACGARPGRGHGQPLVVSRAATVQLSNALKPTLPADAILCADRNRALTAAAHILDVQHHGVNVGAVDRPWHAQSVNAYVSCLRCGMRRLKGVATKYLAFYLGWFLMLDRAPRAELQPVLVLDLTMAE